MSMLSRLTDQLREKADFLQERDALMGIGGAAIMHETAAVMRRAADTIWELRNDCVELRKENEKLRMNANPTEAENARLREMLQDLAICACGKYCYGCPHQNDGCDRDERLREIGIEMEA